MSAEAFTSGSTWSWPEASSSTKKGDTNFANSSEESIPGAFTPEEEEDKPAEPHTPPPNPANYPSRTCRICLEVVQPSVDLGDGVNGIFGRSARVQYISEDTESGRLIRPCKCKGSQRYVHENCLQSWRHADPAYGNRNYWECPTCHFRYHLQRMKWSRWIRSTATQIFLTVFILLLTVFLLGFVADPIINLYLDPVTTLTTNPLSSSQTFEPMLDDEEYTWAEHILKGIASLGLLGFIKVFFAMSPWQWFNLRNSGMIGGGVRNGRAANGRDRLESISWTLVIIGIGTFLWVSDFYFKYARCFTDLE